MARKRSAYKISKSTLILIALTFIALLLIFYQFYVVNNNALSTQLAGKTTVYNAVTTQAVFIRQETALAPVSGMVVQSVKDGGRVGKEEEIAKVFSDETAAQNYTRILQLREKLDYYNDLQSQTLGEAADIISINKSILESVGKFAVQKNTNSLVDIGALDMELNDVLTRRLLLTGETIDFTPVISLLEQQIASLQSAGAAPRSTVVADMSGNFALGTDGYEDYFDYAKVGEYTVDGVKTYLADTAQKKPVDYMGKIITNFDWYIACVVDSGAVTSIKKGSQVTVCVSSNTQLEVKATVYAKNMDSAQSGECALILECQAMNQDISTLRNEEIEIRMVPYTGLRIDSRAIRVVEEQKGVYVLISNKVVFRKIEVLYSGDGYVIAALDNSDNESIRLYDAVIIEGRDLYDGKFIN